MRRNDREIKERAEILEVMKNCAVCRIALNGEDGYPYILPLNFGMEEEDGRVTLFFHSATEGTKLALIARDNRASFEMDAKHQLCYFKEKGYCTYAYESVIGKGTIRILREEEKIHALECLMDHYYPGQHMSFALEGVPRTVVYALKVESMTGKKKSFKAEG